MHFLHYGMFESIFGIHYTSFSAFSKTPWPIDFDIPFEKAKKSVALESPDPLPLVFGPKNLCFEARVVAHTVATTLLTHVGSLYTLSERDTLFTYNSG